MKRETEIDAEYVRLEIKKLTKRAIEVMNTFIISDHRIEKCL